MSQPRLRFTVEALETRDTPTILFTESFNETAPPALPSGWSTWSSDGTTTYATAANQGVGNTTALISNAGSRTATMAWAPQTVTGDTGAAVSMNLNSLVPVYAFARGENLTEPNSKSYLAAVVTRGMKVELLEVKGSSTRVLGNVNSPSSAYFSGGWVRVSLVPTGSTVQVEVTRQDTGQYLTPSGTWQKAETAAITATTSLPDVSGQVGVGRNGLYYGPVALDDFSAVTNASPPVVPPPPVSSVTQSFDTTAVGSAPADWGGWSSDSLGGFKAESSLSLSTANGFASNGYSNTAARAWSNTAMPADVDASAAIYLNSLIPAQVFVRGTNLQGATPTYYAVEITRGLQVSLVKVVDGVQTTLGTLKSSSYVSNEWVRARVIAVGNDLRLQVYRVGTQQWLKSDGSWSGSQTDAIEIHDSSVTGGGDAGVARRALYAGAVAVDDFNAQPASASAGPLPVPTIPQHYDYIRIAELAYSGTPVGNSFEQNLLKNSVDLLVSNPQYLSEIQATAPNTPQLIYNNLSNLYGGSLLSWLNYAEGKGISAESAFYHVTQATPFTGASSSSQPVDWFWGVYQSNGTATPTDLTSAARGGSNSKVQFGGAGTTTAIGYNEPFREIDISLARAAAAGWSGVWQYATAVDANGNPTAWKTLNLIQDGTHGLTASGQITFDPPADWVPASIGPGGARLYYVRFQVTGGSSAASPQMNTILGADYVNAKGGTSGTIPAFDYSADKNHDGYLNDAEYANRKQGMDARFVYQSRLFYPYYGQERYVTNPSSTAVQAWAAQYYPQVLQQNPLAAGFFMDNSTGKLPFAGVNVLEPTATYSQDSGTLMVAVSRAIAPKWVLANTAGGLSSADATVAGSAAAFEEFMLRPMATTWSGVGDAAALVAERLGTPNSPYLVIDSSAQGGSPTDGRTQLATLAYYYLLGNPKRTFLSFYGGDNPSTSWTQHWSPAVNVNVGQPTGSLRVFASGKDPANPNLTYEVFARDYSNALVLYKPLSYTRGQGTGTTADNSATIIQLQGTYRIVNADGTLGSAVTSVTLRNGEGAILMKA